MAVNVEDWEKGEQVLHLVEMLRLRRELLHGAGAGRGSLLLLHA